MPREWLISDFCLVWAWAFQVFSSISPVVQVKLAYPQIHDVGEMNSLLFFIRMPFWYKRGLLVKWLRSRDCSQKPFLFKYLTLFSCVDVQSIDKQMFYDVKCSWFEIICKNIISISFCWRRYAAKYIFAEGRVGSNLNLDSWSIFPISSQLQEQWGVFDRSEMMMA